MISQLLLMFLCCLAIVQDLLTRKIKNVFNISAAVLAFLCVAVTGDVTVRDALFGFLCALVSGILLWKLGAVRAGDAKFFWCIGILKGWRAFWVTLSCAILAGGVMALGILLVKRDFRRRFARLWNHLKGVFLMKSYQRYESEDPQEFPFSVPLAAGCLAEWAIRVWL